MPLYLHRVVAALEEKVSSFQSSEQQLISDLDILRTSLTSFEHMSSAEIERAIATIPSPGARPTTEQDTAPSLIIPFGSAWPHHRAAREWALQTLQDVTTFAADGSQISPQKDLSIPIGLVQIGWFENPHNAALPYTKDVAVEVLSGEELSGEESSFGDRAVEWRRFSGEVDHAIKFMEEHTGQPAVTFFDGSLVVSFVGQMQPAWQARYVEAVKRLLSTSERTHVPLVGYVDTSYATDMTSLLLHLSGSEHRLPISDSTLLRPLMKWGDRCRMFKCNRDDQVLDKSFYETIYFTYLKTTQDNIPARVELPRWVFDDGLHDWVLDIIRAECVVGLGYPYVLETADAVAVLSMEDRERFYRLFQEFAGQQALPLRLSRKATSKRERRV